MDELRTGLELATDEELELLTEILFGRKFNPLDYVYTPTPLDVQSRDRQSWLDALEDRFRFLAADGVTVLQRKTHGVSYRQVLVQICRHLKVSFTQSMSTVDLEAEIFLALAERIWKKLPAHQQRALNQELQQAISNHQLATQMPVTIKTHSVDLMLKGGGVLAVNSVIRPWLLRLIARQFALHAATYQAASQALVRGGVAAAAQIQSHVAAQTAYRSMTLSAARYGAVRSVFAVLGPVLWGWFLADLGWRAIATNYNRVIPVVFTLAQIRLTRDLISQPA